MLINREIFYIKYSSDNADIEGTPHRAIRPVGMNDADFNTMLNFFRKLVDETKVDGLRYSDETLMKNNLNHFCLGEGTLLFKVIEAAKMPGSGVPELYGFYTPMSGVRAMWLEIDKMCYLLASEAPGSTKDGQIDYELLSTYDSNSVHGVKSFYRTSLENMVKDLMSKPFPFNAALTSAPEELYPKGVKFYSNGISPEKTDSTLKEVEIEFDDKKIRYTTGKCNPPLKGAYLVSVPYEDEKKGGFLKRSKKGEGAVKAVRQWRYDYTQNGESQSENCDFIVLDKAFEYSPVGDTFNAYTGKIGANAERLPRVEGARLVSKVATLEPEELEEPEVQTTKVSESDYPVYRRKEVVKEIEKIEEIKEVKEPVKETEKIEEIKAVKEPAKETEEIKATEKVEQTEKAGKIEKAEEVAQTSRVQEKPKVAAEPKIKPHKQPKAPKPPPEPKVPKAHEPKQPKQPKAPKPLKTKPGEKLHPLLQQAEEKRLAEAEAAANKGRGSVSEAATPVHHHHYSESARPARSRFGAPRDEDGAANKDGGADSAPVRRPPPPPPPPRAGADRPMRSKFGPKVHPLLRQAEENEKDEPKPSPLPRYSPQSQQPRPKQDSENQNAKSQEMTQKEED